MKIDILIPTRDRPQRLAEVISSIQNTASANNYCIYIYIDNDDQKTLQVVKNIHFSNISFHVSEQKVLSECWNDLYLLGNGEILMHAADDIIFETYGWDEIVIEHFKKHPVSLLYGDDCWQRERLCTHSFTSRKAADAIGYFVPPYFEADGNDVWLQEVYTGLGEYYYEPRIITRHLHRAVDSKYDDETYRISDERRKRADKVWHEKKHLIQDDIQKLKTLL